MMATKITKFESNLFIWLEGEPSGLCWIEVIQNVLWIGVDFEKEKISIGFNNKNKKDELVFKKFPKSNDFTEERFKELYRSFTGRNFEEDRTQPKYQYSNDLKKRLFDIYYSLVGKKVISGVTNDEIENFFCAEGINDIYQVLVE